MRPGRINRLAMAVLACVFVGCAGALSPENQERLSSAEAAYADGNDATVVTLADRILAEQSRGEGALRALYLRGMARYRMHDWAGARQDLEAVYRRTDNVQLHVDAQNTLAEMAYRDGRLDEAKERFEDVVADVEPGKSPADHAHYRLGQIAQQEGQWADGDVHFQRVMFSFDGTEQAQQARRRAGGRYWTIQLGAYSTKARADEAAATTPGSRVEPMVQDKSLHFLVLVGKYEKYADAEAALAEAKKTQGDAFLTVGR